MSFNAIDSASIDNLFPPSLTILDLSGNQAINIQRDSLTSLRYALDIHKSQLNKAGSDGVYDRHANFGKSTSSRSLAHAGFEISRPFSVLKIIL